MRRISFQKMCAVTGLALVTLLGSIAFNPNSAAHAYSYGPQTNCNSWTIEADSIHVVDKNEDSDDEPYVGVIKFRVTPGVANSTSVSFLGNLSELEVENGGQTAKIPENMGRATFSNVGQGEVIGTAMFVMESDATPFSSIGSLVNNTAIPPIRTRLQALESVDTIAQALRDLSTPTALFNEIMNGIMNQWLSIAVSSWGDPDDVMGVASKWYWNMPASGPDANNDGVFDRATVSGVQIAEQNVLRNRTAVEQFTWNGTGVREAIDADGQYDVTTLVHGCNATPSLPGQVDIGRIETSARIGPLATTSHYGAGISASETFTVGTTALRVNMKQGEGKLWVDRINPNGSATNLRSRSGRKWTHVESYSSAGTTYVLMYEQSTGQYQIDSARADGFLTMALSGVGPIGATSVVPMAGTHVLFANANSGAMSIRRLVSGLPQTWSSGSGAQGTQFAYYNTLWGGRVAAYRTGDGRVLTYPFISNGTLGLAFIPGQTFEAGATSIEPFSSVAGIQGLLLINRNNGDVSVRQLGATMFNNAPIYTGRFNPGWHDADVVRTSGGVYLQLTNGGRCAVQSGDCRPVADWL